MVDVWLPYGKSQVCVRIPTRNFLGCIEPRERQGVSDSKSEIERAVKEPFGSKKLSDIVKPESLIAIAVDYTPIQSCSYQAVPILIDCLNTCGVKNENVTVILACGLEGPVQAEEAAKLLGEQVCNRVKIVSHDCRAQDLVNVGTTKTHGTKVTLNRQFVAADVRILVGEINLHPFAGYGGGRQTVLPGVSGEETIRQNHSLLLDSNAKPGVLLGNPVAQDMSEAAAMARIDFVVNVVANGKRELVKAFAGDVEQVFSEGVKLVDEMFKTEVDKRADIVILSPGGDPFDANLYQAYEGVENSLEVVKRGGAIVLVAELAQGHGNQEFYEWMMKLPDLKAAEREIKRNFANGGSTAYNHMKALQKVRIILVSSMPDYYGASVFRLKTSRAVNDALNEAMNLVGKTSKIWAIPSGNVTLSEIRTSDDQTVVSAG
jgi:nickel-dependent lactate racemase